MVSNTAMEEQKRITDQMHEHRQMQEDVDARFEQYIKAAPLRTRQSTRLHIATDMLAAIVSSGRIVDWKDCNHDWFAKRALQFADALIQAASVEDHA